jgi:hypothetical protein
MMAITFARQSASPADAPCSADQSGIMSRFARQFWICTARYNFQDLTANNNNGN